MLAGLVEPFVDTLVVDLGRSGAVAAGAQTNVRIGGVRILRQTPRDILGGVAAAAQSTGDQPAQTGTDQQKRHRVIPHRASHAACHFGRTGILGETDRAVRKLPGRGLVLQFVQRVGQLLTRILDPAFDLGGIR